MCMHETASGKGRSWIGNKRLVIGAVAGVQEQLHRTMSRSTSSILDKLCGELIGANLLPDDGTKTL